MTNPIPTHQMSIERIDTAVTNIAHALELDLQQYKDSDHLRDVASSFITPAVDACERVRVVLRASKTGGSVVSGDLQEQLHTLTKGIGHDVVVRACSAVSADDCSILQAMITNNWTHLMNESAKQDTPPMEPTTPSFSLLKQVNKIFESDNVSVPDQSGIHAPLPPTPNGIKIPSSVRTALTNKRKELQEALDAQIKAGKKDWAYHVPGMEFPFANRIRVGLDGAIGMLEWLEGVLNHETVSYDDLRNVVIRLSTFGNVQDQYIPSEVVRFLYTAGSWNNWKEDTKFGKTLDGTDPNTGFKKD